MKRVTFLNLCAKLGILSLGGFPSIKSKLFAMGKDKSSVGLIEHLVRQIKSQEITAEQLVGECIQSIENQKRLGAILFFDETKKMALEKARDIDLKIKNGERVGSLAGIPFLVKDNIDVAGVSTTAASKALAGHKPLSNASVVKTLFNQDAIVLAKANMHEFAFGITSLNGAYGDVLNYFDNKRIAGGSSGGSAIGVASGMSPFGLATDTGGSSRITAALNGLVGYRPTLKRYSQQGVVLISPTRDTVGLIAKNVEDVIYLDKVMVGDKQRTINTTTLKGLRFGVPVDYYYQNLSKEVNRLIQLQLKKMQEAGIILVEESIPNLKELNDSVSFPVALFEAKESLLSYLQSNDLDFKPKIFFSQIYSLDVRGVYEASVFGGFIKQDQYKQAKQEARPALISAINDYYKKYNLDAIVFPMTPVEACKTDEVKNNKVKYELGNGQIRELTITPGNDMVFSTYIQNADPGSNAGNPGVTIPMGTTDQGLPVGLGIDCLSGEDEKLMAIAKSLQSL